MPRELPITPETRILLTDWLDTWNTPDLATRAKIELSPRLTRFMGAAGYNPSTQFPPTCRCPGPRPVLEPPAMMGPAWRAK